MARLGQAPVRSAPRTFGTPEDLGAPGQRFHNIAPPGGDLRGTEAPAAPAATSAAPAALGAFLGQLGDAGDVSGTSFLAQEGDGKGTLLLGDVGAMMASLGAAPARREALGAASATVVKVTKGTAGNATYREYTTSDGYVIRRYDNDDGDLYIVKSPISSKMTILSQGDKKTGKAWASLDALVRAADAGQKPKGIDPKILVAAIKGGSSVSVALIEAAGGKKHKKHKKKADDSSAETDEGTGQDEETVTSFPWLPVAAVGAGLLLVFILSGRKAS